MEWRTRSLEEWSPEDGKARSEIIACMITKIAKNHDRDWRVPVNQCYIFRKKQGILRGGKNSCL